MSHLPFYKRDGNEVFRQWEVRVTDAAGARILTKVAFGKTPDKVTEATIRVVWL